MTDKEIKEVTITMKELKEAFRLNLNSYIESLPVEENKKYVESFFSSYYENLSLKEEVKNIEEPKDKFSINNILNSATSIFNDYLIPILKVDEERGFLIKRLEWLGKE